MCSNNSLVSSHGFAAVNVTLFAVNEAIISGWNRAFRQAATPPKCHLNHIYGPSVCVCHVRREKWGGYDSHWNTVGALIYIIFFFRNTYLILEVSLPSTCALNYNVKPSRFFHIVICILIHKVYIYIYIYFLSYEILPRLAIEEARSC